MVPRCRQASAGPQHCGNSFLLWEEGQGPGVSQEEVAEWLPLRPEELPGAGEAGVAWGDPASRTRGHPERAVLPQQMNWPPDGQDRLLG